jgi:hypothetical protein
MAVAATPYAAGARAASVRRRHPRLPTGCTRGTALPLSTADAWELSWYFGELKRRATSGPETPEPRFVEAARRFRAPRVSALYRTWERGNSNAHWNTTTSGLVDAFESGDATLEFVALTRKYLYLTHLVGTA